MEAYYNWLNSLVNKNKSDFLQWKDLNWLNVYNSYEAQQHKSDLLADIGDNLLFKDTKPYYNRISKGCSICGSGKWSCLFITNRCNANCFYCPAPQNNDEIPGTQGFEFKTADEFADYINYFNYKGVSFSGGEPLLYFERTLEYLKKVREKCSPDIYIWMYTNGILADISKMKALADAGIDEVRFDIGATGFSLDRIAAAKGIIPNITIEIPAVPEEKDKLIALLPDMINAGVTNLNLHQLRLTAHNAKHIERKGYTIINAERPIVLESELAALEIVNAARNLKLDIGVNYCTFFFKHRFQKAGFRKQMISRLLSDDVVVSENGYIREFYDNNLIYKTIVVSDSSPELGTFIEFDISGKTYYYKIDIIFQLENMNDDTRMAVESLLENEPNEIPEDEILFKIWQLEYIERGIREY